MRQWIETASVGIELLAVAVIVGSVTFGSIRFLLDLSRRTTDAYSSYKDLIGRSLLLGLEFLVAADVIRTVALELTAKYWHARRVGRDPNIPQLVRGCRDRGPLAMAAESARPHRVTRSPDDGSFSNSAPH